MANTGVHTPLVCVHCGMYVKVFADRRCQDVTF